MTRMSPSSKRIPAFRAEPAMRFERSSPRRISGNRGMRNSRKPEAAAEVSFEEEADSEGLAMSAEEESYASRGKLSPVEKCPVKKERAGRLLQASAPPAIMLTNRSVRSAVRFVIFFLVLRFIRLLVFWTFLLLLLLLLLFLLQLLLFQAVFVLHLLELPLLFLLDLLLLLVLLALHLFQLLLLSLLGLLLLAVVRSFLLSSLLFLLLLLDPLPLLVLSLAEPFLILLNFLLLLDLLLLDPLPFLVLFLTELLGFLLMLLFELRVHISRRIARIVWPHRRRTVVVDSRIAGIRGRIARLVARFVDVLIRRRRTVLHNGRVCGFHLRLTDVARSSR